MTLQVIRGGVIVQSVALAQHTATMHVGSAARAAADGVASLDGSGDVPLAQVPDTLTGKDADTLDGQHHSDISSEIDGDITTHAALDQNVHGAGAAETLLNSGDKNVVNGIVGLDANILMNPVSFPWIAEEYSNCFGVMDASLQKTEVGTGTVSDDAANNEFDFDAPANGDSAYLETVDTHTLDTFRTIIVADLRNLVAPYGNARGWVGLHDATGFASPANGIGWRMQNQAGNERIEPFVVNGGSYTGGSSIVATSGFLMIVATTTQILFYRNGVLVDTINTDIPTGAYRLRCVVADSDVNIAYSVGTIGYRKCV